MYETGNDWRALNKEEKKMVLRCNGCVKVILVWKKENKYEIKISLLGNFPSKGKFLEYAKICT